MPHLKRQGGKTSQKNTVLARREPPRWSQHMMNCSFLLKTRTLVMAILNSGAISKSQNLQCYARSKGPGKETVESSKVDITYTSKLMLSARKSSLSLSPEESRPREARPEDSSIYIYIYIIEYCIFFTACRKDLHTLPLTTYRINSGRCSFKY